MEHPLVFEATLPWPPTVNNYYRHKVIGKLATVYVTQEGKAYRKAVNLSLMEHGVKTYQLEGDLRVEIEVFPPDRRKRDLDNLLKSLLDSLTHVQVWKDDSQIADLRIYRNPTIAGLVKVRVYELERPTSDFSKSM
jgi:crossover junction endodeoxyribonuclease RusA